MNLFPSFPLDRPPPEGGIKESSSWGTQRTQDVFYETRSPAFERGHSEEIPIERVSKRGQGGKGEVQILELWENLRNLGNTQKKAGEGGVR